MTSVLVRVEGSSTPEQPEDGSVPAARRNRRFPFARLTLAVLLLGLLVVGLLAWASWKSYDDNENRLLGLKAKEAASVLSASVPRIQTPLAAAAELANASGGNPQEFEQLMAPYVASGGPFVSASLWRLDAPSAGPITTVGLRSDLASEPAAAADLFSRAQHSPLLSLTGILRAPALRLGYEYDFVGPKRFAAYAEAALPTDRQANIAQNAAFSDIHYALYLGRSQQTAGLVATDLKVLPVTGRQQTIVIPFGDSAFTLAITPRGPLTGVLSERLPWIIAILGTLLAATAALVTEWLVRRRREAEGLAAALDRAAAASEALHAQQRSIAQTLQQALLPQALPRVPGLDGACRYVPGTKGMEIGGDWYDLVPLVGGKAFFVVGDVSGRGVEAAAVMARLRYATVAYALQGDPPDAVLTKLSRLVTLEDSEHFATVLCGLVDPAGHEMVLANAGHLPCLVLGRGTAQIVSAKIGLPVGVSERAAYAPMTVSVPSKATVLAFTDGMVERRGEPLDASLGRLSDVAKIHQSLSLDELVATLVEEFTGEGIEDDAAILGVRWHN